MTRTTQISGAIVLVTLLLSRRSTETTKLSASILTSVNLSSKSIILSVIARPGVSETKFCGSAGPRHSALLIGATPGHGARAFGSETCLKRHSRLKFSGTRHRNRYVVQNQTARNGQTLLVVLVKTGVSAKRATFGTALV